jgi:hypothetical protein
MSRISYSLLARVYSSFLSNPVVFARTLQPVVGSLVALLSQVDLSFFGTPVILEQPLKEAVRVTTICGQQEDNRFVLSK